ncbi:hypothetical protein GCM10010174_09610 [Kutzneria viridogrisea]|uniref:Uncharacterized protein n=2 Tax=Kutzneria TaxID=43356 RepID=W5WKP3_9PSEU|nr:hypothetical protein [Kutzneria albida]AHI01438.1 hypothetical protein KALB_8080 [Kutzneria albida DSM 43870]MBA8931398.1 hypothetical protein [Kutzneria viridogrisea]
MASLMANRRHDLDEFLEWIAAQPRTADLPRRAVRHWLERVTPEHLQAMRLAHANQPLMRRLASSGRDVRAEFGRVVDLLLGEGAGEQDRLLLRMAFDTASAALLASLGADTAPDVVLAVARKASDALAQTITD